MAELVGSAKAIQDGLKAVSKIVSEEMNSWTDDQREKCGKIEEWTVFGEEFLEDLGVSKHDFVAQMRSKEQLRKPRTKPDMDRDRQSETRWRAAAPNRHVHPDFSLKIPRVAERFLLGYQGRVIKGIGNSCRTRCYLERRLVEPCVQIRGTRVQIDRVVEEVDTIILQACSSWRVGEARERWGPGWGRTPTEQDATRSYSPSASPERCTEHSEQSEDASSGDRSSQYSATDFVSSPEPSSPPTSASSNSSETLDDKLGNKWRTRQVAKGLIELPEDQRMEALRLFAAHFGQTLVPYYSMAKKHLKRVHGCVGGRAFVAVFVGASSSFGSQTQAYSDTGGLGLPAGGDQNRRREVLCRRRLQQGVVF